MSISEKCVMVTGGADGIGHAIAETFAAHGALAHVCDIDAKKVADLQRPDEGVGATCANVAEETEVNRFFEDALQRFNGRLDVLVNNAGIAGPTGPIESMDFKAWKDTFDVNIHGSFLCLRHAVPIMKAAGRGSIINISSTAGFLGYPLRTPYAAAKWAVIGLTKSLAMELGPSGIRVNAICPGPVSGTRIDRVIDAEADVQGVSPEEIRQGYLKQISMRTFIDAQDIAETVMFLCSDQGAKISGQALAVDGYTETLRTAD
ncbi:MAG: SDR family oxidoreductase [Gammaproteobacteria bacterium]|nr:SDR family oxidoreductase [Gammaproteobacteria bacterium]